MTTAMIMLRSMKKKKPTLKMFVRAFHIGAFPYRRGKWLDLRSSETLIKCNVTLMTPETMTLLAKALAIAVGGFAPALGIGLIGFAAMNGIARNPEASGRIFVPMLLGMAFAEAIAIYALIIAFTL
jgi:F-type H+-transporting ATPase subunit c